MRNNTLDYPVQNAQLAHWLAVGPCPLSQDAPDQPDFASLPVELALFTSGTRKEVWQVAHAGADGVLSAQVREPLPPRVQWWAFCQVAISQPGSAHLVLEANAAARVWWDGVEILTLVEQDQPRSGERLRASVELSLPAATHSLFIRLDANAAGSPRLAFAARLEGSLQAKLLLPTVTRQAERRLALEASFAYAHLAKPILTRADVLTLQWPSETPGGGKECLLRLQSPSEAIYAETMGAFRPGKEIRSVTGAQLPAGEMQAVLMPPFAVFYNEKVRAQRSLPFQVAHAAFFEQPQAEFEDRRALVLQTAAARQGLTAELARAALGQSALRPETINAALQHIQSGMESEGSPSDWLSEAAGLLALALRYPASTTPALLDQILAVLRQAADQISQSMAARPQTSQSEALALAAIPLLIADLFEDDELPYRQSAEQQALAVLEQCARCGFLDWNSDFERFVPNLILLSEFAASEPVYALAGALLDRMLFGQALHSLRGVYGAPQRRFPTAALLSARFHPAVATGYLMWGTGSLDGDLTSAVHLAVSEEYRLPEIIEAVALHHGQPGTATDEPTWTIENSVRPQVADSLSELICRASYRTGDYLLASVLDYRPGQPGDGERVWLASLSADAQVFTCHPNPYTRQGSPLASEGRLPRLAQWKDSLLALYTLPEDDPAPYTLAHFPQYAFDESRFAGGWAFARVGLAYLGLYAPAARLIERGELAFRALHAPGQQAAWLCQMGRQADDGSFDNFCQRCLHAAPVIDGLNINWLNLRGDQLAFGWQAPFTVNEQPFPSPDAAQAQLTSPFGSASLPAESLNIIYGDLMLRLHFKA